MTRNVCWERFVVRTLVVLFVLAISFAAQAREATFNAGFTGRDVPGDPPFPVAVWYPTEAEESTWLAGPYSITAARDAAPAPGPFPLVVISHGGMGSELGHRDWADYLARRGFVVVAVRHVGDSFDDFSGRGTDVQLNRRPTQVREALDAVLADPVLAPAVDPDRIGIVGFSAGGYTALKTVGAEPKFALCGAHCRAHSDDLELCPSDGHEMPRITRPGWQSPPPDPRVKAAVAMAPLAVVFDKEALSGVNVPVRLYRAADDRHVQNRWNADIVAANLPAAPEVVTVPGDHYVFLPPCPPAMAAEVPEEVCTDAPGVGRAAIHARIGEELVEFFDRTLGP
jgi:predicted dienelactone hydrolase